MKLNPKLILPLGLVAGLALIGLLTAFLNNQPVKIGTGVRFYISPSDAEVLLNGQRLKLDRANQAELAPGNYEVEIVRVHFASKKENFTVSSGQVSEVPVLLTPLNDLAWDFLRSGSEPQIRESVSYRLSLKTSQQVAEALPLTTKLPYSTVNFRIDYGVSQKFPDDPSKVALYISTEIASDEARQPALDWLRSQGVDPAQTEIIYRTF